MLITRIKEKYPETTAEDSSNPNHSVLVVVLVVRPLLLAVTGDEQEDAMILPLTRSTLCEFRIRPLFVPPPRQHSLQTPYVTVYDLIYHFSSSREGSLVPNAVTT
jgi:hypothetical protein